MLCVMVIGCSARADNSQAVTDSNTDTDSETFRENYREDTIMGEWLWEGDTTCVLNFMNDGNASYTGTKITGIGNGLVEFDWRYIEAAGRYQLTDRNTAETAMAYFPQDDWGETLQVFGYGFVRRENWEKHHSRWQSYISDQNTTKVELTAENAGEYMELVKMEVTESFPGYDENKDYYILKSKMYEKGLIYIGGEDSGAWVGFKDSENMTVGGYFIFNSYIEADKGTVPQISAAGGTMVFGTRAHIANYKIENGKRTVWLQDGNSSTAEGVFVSPRYPF